LTQRIAIEDKQICIFDEDNQLGSRWIELTYNIYSDKNEFEKNINPRYERIKEFIYIDIPPKSTKTIEIELTKRYIFKEYIEQWEEYEFIKMAKNKEITMFNNNNNNCNNQYMEKSNKIITIEK